MIKREIIKNRPRWLELYMNGIPIPHIAKMYKVTYKCIHYNIQKEKEKYPDKEFKRTPLKLKMKKAKTKKQYEEFLNQLYDENGVAGILYLMNKRRANPVSEYNFYRYVENKKCGTMIRKYDPIAFEVNYADFKYN